MKLLALGRTVEPLRTGHGKKLESSSSEDTVHAKCGHFCMIQAVKYHICTYKKIGFVVIKRLQIKIT